MVALFIIIAGCIPLFLTFTLGIQAGVALAKPVFSKINRTLSLFLAWFGYLLLIVVVSFATMRYVHPYLPDINAVVANGAEDGVTTLAKRILIQIGVMLLIPVIYSLGIAIVLRLLFVRKTEE